VVVMDMELSSRVLSQWQGGEAGSGVNGSDDNSRLNKIVVTPRGKSSLCKLFCMISLQS